ncbi:MAG: molybdate ABC transporter substrate-binding protein [Spongiibacteraceae bacterium]
MFVVLIVTAIPAPVFAGRVHVAAASNFSAPLRDITALFEQQTGHQLVVSLASSAKIVTQLLHGAPFDIFLSADQEKPRTLQAAGFVASGDRHTYAIGRLALWSKKVNYSDGERGLREGRFQYLAMANPQLAPYGMAAEQVLKTLSLQRNYPDRIVLGENIAQCYLYVASGAADVGFVALSQLRANMVSSDQYWLVPESLHEPIRQDVVILQRAANNAAAREFIAFLLGAEVRAVIARYGYRQK